MSSPLKRHFKLHVLNSVSFTGTLMPDVLSSLTLCENLLLSSDLVGEVRIGVYFHQVKHLNDCTLSVQAEIKVKPMIGISKTASTLGVKRGLKSNE